MITAIHSILYARDAEAARAFFADVLELDSVDAGGGWLIFALPPAELAVHPAEDAGRQELYLMTDDIETTLAQLRERGVEIAADPSDQGWGVLASIEVPGFGPLGLYEPRHPVPR
ncbi:MAG TPA: VOC family protein [Solirubrobacteraceae bacterium]|nr:VOC family protein [Solirubrobacteraceae bacterium]